MGVGLLVLGAGGDVPGWVAMIRGVLRRLDVMGSIEAGQDVAFVEIPRISSDQARVLIRLLLESGFRVGLRV